MGPIGSPFAADDREEGSQVLTCADCYGQPCVPGVCLPGVWRTCIDGNGGVEWRADGGFLETCPRKVKRRFVVPNISEESLQ